MLTKNKAALVVCNLIWALTFAAAPAASGQGLGGGTVIYETGFEVSDGFDPGFTLVGQSGWVGSNNGGNGLVSGVFDGRGQHAFIGFNPPEGNQTDFINVWRPVNYQPVPPNKPVIQFSVRMQIVPSSGGSRDDFRWSAYNTNGARLFTLDFDTTALQISYSLDKPTDFVATGFGFDTLGAYDLAIWMDFGRNLWTAWLNDTVIVNSKPITASGAALNFGDMDAVWALRKPGSPGDNYMVFDDYRVVAMDAPSVPPRVEQMGIGGNAAFILRVYGQEGLNYSVESTTDWKQWRAMGTFKAPAGGIFDFEDKDALRTPNRFFRVRQVP